MKGEWSHLSSLPKDDIDRLNRIRERLKAANNTEAFRRMSITMETLLDHQDNGGDIVLCKQGMADKAIWFA